MQKLKYIILIILNSQIFFCTAEERDSIKFWTDTNREMLRHKDNYKNYLNMLKNFNQDYGYLKIETVIHFDDNGDTNTRHYYAFDSDKIKKYNNLNAAMAANHDSVFYLDLRNQDLKEFPYQILLFKNLKYLDLTSFSRLEFIDSLPPPKREARVEAIKKNPDMAYGIYYKSNSITYFPEEIKQLKSLILLRTDGEEICQKEYNRLKRLLPKCYIMTDLYELIGYGKDWDKRRRCPERPKTDSGEHRDKREK